MKRVYIASSLMNHERVSIIKKKLEARNITITYDWTPHAQDVINGCQEKSEEGLRQIAMNEFQGIVDADVVLIMMPGRNGTHFEYGMAYVLRKQIVYLDDRSDVDPKFFEPIHFLPEVEYFDDEDMAVDATVAKCHGPTHLMDHIRRRDV